MTIYPNLINPLNYSDYKDLVFKLALDGSTTGEETIERVESTKINAQRIKRIDKTYVPSEEIEKIIEQISSNHRWILLTESWCGDGAQNLPIIAKLAQLNSNINLEIVLRDQNPELMDMHLTSGTRSIPKLIVLDAQTNDLIFEWGPRPASIYSMVQEYKKEHPVMLHDEFVKQLHLWYAHDKGRSLEKDLVTLINTFVEKSKS
ncbi:MAG: thioredoxin family protein [Bacteroidia bacterium]|nr:thioredoxin family protein [Bacteroidia bacterium]